MFIDASAIVAIIVREAEADSLADRLEIGARPLTSPLARYEAVLGIARTKRASTVEAVTVEVDQFLELYRIEQVTVTAEIGSEAIVAHMRYGRGRHKAKLNMGDCFSYACAKVHRVPLLCKGDDFIHTDITIA